MEKEKVVNLSSHLYEASLLMYEINRNTSNVLLEMSSDILSLVEDCLTYEDMMEIQEIERELV